MKALFAATAEGAYIRCGGSIFKKFVLRGKEKKSAAIFGIFREMIAGYSIFIWEIQDSEVSYKIF